MTPFLPPPCLAVLEQQRHRVEGARQPVFVTAELVEPFGLVEGDAEGIDRRAVVAPGPVQQAGLDGGGAAAPAYRPDPEKVRARLFRILTEAKAAETLPWEQPRLSLYRTIFPQMTLWLPEEEGAQLRFEFETELERLLVA